MSETEKLANVGGWEWDIDKDVWTFTDNWLRIHGCSKRHLKSSELIQIAHPDDQSDINKALKMAVSHRENYEIEHRILRQDNGELRYIKACGKIKMDKNGRPVKIYGSAQDITDYKKNETVLKEIAEAAQKDRNTLETLVQTVSIGVIVCDVKGRITLANRLAQELVGGEITGDANGPDGTYELFRVDGSSFPAEELPLVKSIRHNVITNDVELLIKHQDRREFIISASGSPLRDTDGKVRGAVAIMQDITKRKKMEEAIQESERVMRYIIKHDPNALAVYDRDLCYIAVSDRYLQDYNVAESDILGKHHYEVFPEMPMRWKEVHQRVLQGSIERNNDDFFERLDGSITYNRWECRPWYNADGSIGGMITYTEVTTERKLAEIALQKSEMKFKAIFSQSFQFALILDTEGVVMEMNDLCREMCGQFAENVIGNPFWDAGWWKTFSDVRKKTKSAIQEVLKGSKVTDRVLFFDKHKQIRQGFRIFSPITFFNKKIEMISVVGLDITEQEQSKQLNEMLLDSLPHPAMLIDRNRHVIVANRIAREIGTEIGGYCWQTFGRCLSIPEEHKKHMAQHGGALPEGVTKCTFCLADEALINQKPENDEVTVEGSILDTWWVPVDKELFLHYAIDITDRKKFETQIQQAQKMESIGNLAGGIAHDFNNILFPIIGMSEMLLEDLPPDSGEMESAEEIFKAGKRGSDLVKQILAFSRQSEHKMMPTRIQNVLKEVIKLSRSTIPKFIEIKQDIQQDCGMVWADPSQIHQIVMNLITNAYHAIEDKGGTISVRLKQIVLKTPQALEIDLSSGGYAVLSISDTGHGMSEEIIGKIFDPYFTTKEQGKGTGLGLAVAYGIVKEHGGDIKVYSEIGKGSTFEIYLPLMKKAIGTESTPKPEEYKGGYERILLVDDEESIAKLEKQMLERLGYNVTSRISGVDALEAFKASPSSYDLVVTDMSMPNIPGDELARNIKSIRSGVPIIICTGFSERIHDDNFKQMGIDGLLMKPIVKSELAKTVRKLLDEAKNESHD